jgi:N-acetylglucosamine-6-sulfatase
MTRFLSALCTYLIVGLTAFAAEKPRNIIFILSDDHRWDFFSFMPEAPKFLETPNLDRLAKEGGYMRNMFVSTSLCSPSRASILTGLYMHHHHVADNQRLEPPDLRYFPEYLRAAGYTTAFFGKWHMGEDSDAPRKGFDYWAAFRGQGEYFDPLLNVNGERRVYKGYNTDVLTDLALDWLKQPHEKPFFMYLAYKAPHFPFEPAPRNKGRYDKATVPYPPTMANTEQNYETQPRWVRERRYSIHGVDHMETGRFDNDPVPSFENLYRRYAEAVYSIDEDLGRLLKLLDDTGLRDSTLILYMGDNGFELGEHGFYDKRDAFETSMRVPLLAWAPGAIKPGTVITPMVQNIDIAPSVLEAAGVAQPAGTPHMDGRSFWPLLQDREISWRDHVLYEYYWERNFPATPTTLALRTDRWKYIYYHGVWDKDSFYDLQTDPLERHNLINVPAYRDQIAQFQRQLFDEMEKSGGLQFPILPPSGEVLDDRKLPR